MLLRSWHVGGNAAGAGLACLLLLLAPRGTLAASAQEAGSPPKAQSQATGIDFSDKPDFTVAGVTDWTAVGGHGSDATLRTSEELARQTVQLKDRAGLSRGSMPEDVKREAALRAALAAAPQSYIANHELGEYYLRAGNYLQASPLLQTASRLRNFDPEDEYQVAQACLGLGDLEQARHHATDALQKRNTADLHRLLGDLDERSSDPLAAVREYEQAVRLSPSEENYLAWGSELLLHRAVWQAAEVFKEGAKAYPRSANILTSLATALFAADKVEDAAELLCKASDIDPTNSQIYVSIGKVQQASGVRSACMDSHLRMYLENRPQDAAAHYLYAMSLMRRPGEINHSEVERLLHQAVLLNPDYAEAYLELGIIAFNTGQYTDAISSYIQAVRADPSLAEAHYRLGIVYRRTGEQAEAEQELETHARLEKEQAATVEKERRGVKQFLVALQAAPIAGSK